MATTTEAPQVNGLGPHDEKQAIPDFPGAKPAEHSETTDSHANGKPIDSEKQEQQQQPTDDNAHNKDEKKDGEEKKGPEGGFDSTPIPKRPAGYTLKITLHRAENLPVADLAGFSSDPYCLAQINTSTPTRHKEDTPLRWRTPTVRKCTEPTWNDSWIVANIPSSGFKLKVRVYDEDAADHDDLLGKIHITVPGLNENWKGIREEGHKILAYHGSKRAYLVQALTTCFRENKHFRGHLYLSIEMLGRTKEDGQNGRVYTVGPCHWVRHYSPILGRLVNIKDPENEEIAKPTEPQRSQTQNGGEGNAQEQKKKDKQVEHYNFQANQIQFEGPVPAQLYHRFVEFKPWVGRMFTKHGVSGLVMGKALHHQHSRVYNFSRSTLRGSFPQGPCEEMTKQFLDLVHYDQGGRIFTYIITLDSLWRFTETGKEFGVDMLSKHTMHSDVSMYIAFSGEFFVRRLKHARRPPPPEPVEESSQSHPPHHEGNEEHPPADLQGGPPEEDPPKDPSHYEMVIDNDSGTYRPNADLLPLLKEFLARQLPGLHILTLDCNKDAEKQQRMKKEQRERKKAEGDHIIYTQGSRSSSVSSSDEEDLDRIQAGLLDEDAVARQHGAMSSAVKDAKLQNKAKLDKLKRDYLGGAGSKPEGEAGAPATS